VVKANFPVPTEKNQRFFPRMLGICYANSVALLVEAICVSSRFQKYLTAAGVESKPFHALRATCIKLCQQRGWSVEQAAKLLGDTIRVVQEHYTTPSNEELKQVAREKPII